MNKRSPISLVRNADDPLVAIVLWMIAAGTIAALVFAPSITGLSGGEARDAVLKGAGGTLLLLSSYFAARTLKQTRTDQRTGRILQATELLASESTAVQRGAISVLVDIAESSKGRREQKQVTIIQGLIAALAENDPTAAGQAAIRTPPTGLMPGSTTIRNWPHATAWLVVLPATARGRLRTTRHSGAPAKRCVAPRPNEQRGRSGLVWHWAYDRQRVSASGPRRSLGNPARGP